VRKRMRATLKKKMKTMSMEGKSQKSVEEGDEPTDPIWQNVTETPSTNTQSASHPPQHQ
jgi:hypothetical protein